MDFLHQQVPKLFPALDLDEGTGDSWDLDDELDSCAAEGTSQPAATTADTQMAKNLALLDWLLGAACGLILRAQTADELATRIRVLERGALQANNDAQTALLERGDFALRLQGFAAMLEKQEQAIEALKRDLAAARRQREKLHEFVAGEVRSIDEAAATARQVA